MTMNKLEEKIIDYLNTDMKTPREVAQGLRLKRMSQLMQLKDAINSLYTKDVIDTLKLNDEKVIYVKTM